MMKGGGGRFMIFIVEPLFVLPFERIFQGEVEEVMTGMRLDANTAYHFLFGGAGLVFEKEIMLE
jgi:hypothetical protein